MAEVRIALFASDDRDAAVLRRVSALQNGGCEVILFCFSRQRYKMRHEKGDNSVALGELRDRQYVRRVVKLIGALFRVVAAGAKLRECDRIYVKHLDMAILAYLGKWLAKCRAPITYEVLDIAGILESRSMVARTARAVERVVLRSCDDLVVSSEGFIHGYFCPIQGYEGRWSLVENKLAPEQHGACAEATRQAPVLKHLKGQWRLGWFGTLRSPEDLRLLAEVAERLDGLLKVELRGICRRLGEEQLGNILNKCRHISYKGAYDSRVHLPDMYNGVDLMWCGDLVQSELNSKLLLPNRIYEAGCFRVPVIALSGTYTGAYVRENRLGWCMSDKSVGALMKFFEELSPESYNSVVVEMERNPLEKFVGDAQVLDMVNRWHVERA